MKIHLFQINGDRTWIEASSENAIADIKERMDSLLLDIDDYSIDSIESMQIIPEEEEDLPLDLWHWSKKQIGIF